VAYLTQTRGVRVDGSSVKFMNFLAVSQMHYKFISLLLCFVNAVIIL